MKAREAPQGRDDVIPDRLRWVNRPPYDFEHPEAHLAWKAEHFKWYADRGISKLESLRLERDYERERAS